MHNKQVAITFLLALGVLGCRKTPEPRAFDQPMSQQRQDDNADEIYEIINFVIKDQNLSLGHGLETEPERNVEYFIRQVTASDSAQDVKTLNIPLNADDTLVIRQPNKLQPTCLTQEEMDYVAPQLNAHKNFRWDNARLHFNQQNTNNWYAFSLPLLSKDKMKAIITIRDLCPGLCGHGWIVCLTKENNKWASQRTLGWWH